MKNDQIDSLKFYIDALLAHRKAKKPDNAFSEKLKSLYLLDQIDGEVYEIKYEGLVTYFRGFSVWEGLQCLSWDDTLLWFEELRIQPVKTLYRGLWDEDAIKAIDSTQWREGYVVRVTDSFHRDEFKTVVAKYVRANHVQTEERWDEGVILKNGL